MSEWHVRVFRIGKVGKHPNADTLSITQGPSGYPVVFKTGEFTSGDLAIHIPVDALVDTARPEFAWLAKDATLAGDGRFLFRVKPIQLRKIPSYGFLVPLSALPELSDSGVPFKEGELVAGYLDVQKYEPGPCHQLSGIVQGNMVSLPQDGMVPLYDIEGMRRYRNVIAPGELVSVTEKIHGSNGRWTYLGGQFLCGSRTKFRTDSVWNRLADEYNLEYILSLPENAGLVLYGEVYGKGIQDMEYGLEEPDVIFFDLYDTKTGLWRTPDEFALFCYTYGLPRVPELYRGPYDAEAIAEMAEGASTLPGAHHVREGIVVKPLVERWDQSIGRVFLKQPGEGYLLRKGPNEEGVARAAFATEDPQNIRQYASFWQRVKAFLGFRA